jgi:hypothetical protein
MSTSRRNSGNLRSVLRVSTNVIPNSPILFTQMMEAISSSEKPVITRAMGRKIPGDGSLQVVGYLNDYLSAS